MILLFGHLFRPIAAAGDPDKALPWPINGGRPEMSAAVR
jgi:hypothetical protein